MLSEGFEAQYDFGRHAGAADGTHIPSAYAPNARDLRMLVSLAYDFQTNLSGVAHGRYGHALNHEKDFIVPGLKE